MCGNVFLNCVKKFSVSLAEIKAYVVPHKMRLEICELFIPFRLSLSMV